MKWLVVILLAIPFAARADEVSIEWQKIKKASQYELQVTRGKEVVLDKLFVGVTNWKGDLPFGVYSYRLRTLDRKKRTSPWSEPTPFLVTPAAPQLLVPPDTSTVFYKPAMTTAFKWSKTIGIEKYLFELVIPNSEPLRRVVKASETTVTGLKPGGYEWRVKPMLESATGGERQAQVIDDKSSRAFTFRIDASPDEARALAAATTDTVTQRRFSVDFNAGTQVGVHFLLPTAQFAVAMRGGLALGVRGLYASDGAGAATLDAYGAAASLAWFSGPENFEGIFFEAGVGGLTFAAKNATKQETKLSPLAYGVGGWRWHPAGIGLNIGIAAGVEYVSAPAITVIQTQIKETLPFAQLTLGYSF